MKRAFTAVAISFAICVVLAMPAESAEALPTAGSLFDGLRASVAEAAALLRLKDAKVSVLTALRTSSVKTPSLSLHVTEDEHTVTITWDGGSVSAVFITNNPPTASEKVDSSPLLKEFLTEVCSPETALLLAGKASNWELRASSMSGVADQAALSRFAVEDAVGGVRAAAARCLTDQSLLTKIARNDKDDEVRAVAVGKLADESTLADIARNDAGWVVRAAAVKGIADQDIVALIALRDDSIEVAGAAVNVLNDQALLRKAAEEARNQTTRLAAVARITDQVRLASIAVEGKNVDVCIAAMRKMTDEAALSRVAEESKDCDVRAAARSLVARQARLRALAEHGSALASGALAEQAGGVGYGLDEEGIVEMMKKLDQASVARYVVGPSADFFAATAMVKKLLTDQALLARVAVEAKIRGVRLAAVGKLNDSVVLTKVAGQDASDMVREAAQARLKELSK